LSKTNDRSHLSHCLRQGGYLIPSICNCNYNWGTCIAPPTRRPRAHHRVNPYPGACRQNKTKMFSDHD